jgi:hypothetical protein
MNGAKPGNPTCCQRTARRTMVNLFQVDPSWYECYWWSDPAPRRRSAFALFRRILSQRAMSRVCDELKNCCLGFDRSFQCLRESRVLILAQQCLLELRWPRPVRPKIERGASPGSGPARRHYGVGASVAVTRHQGIAIAPIARPGACAPASRISSGPDRGVQSGPCVGAPTSRSHRAPSGGSSRLRLQQRLPPVCAAHEPRDPPG